MAKKNKYSKELIYLLQVVLVILVLLLSTSNLTFINKGDKIVSVLGVNTSKDFWIEFTSKHPDYIDGWIELQRFDKVNEIDPNYFK